MRILRIDIIFLFIFLIWIDSAISRSPVKTARERPSTRRLSLDLSSANDPTELISRAFTTVLKDLKKQIQHQQPVTISFLITPPENSQEQYVDLIERTLRDLMAQWIFLPMQGLIRTEVKGNNDGTIANMTVIMSIVPSEPTPKNKTPNSESIRVDLSKPNVDMMQILQQVLAIAVQNPSVRLNGDMSNHMKLQVIPPAGTTESSVHGIVGAIQSTLITLLPDTEFSIKATISKEPDGSVTIINCVVNLNQRRDNSFTFTVDISKTTQGLDNAIVNILQNIQQEVEVLFDENKPVFLSLKVKPSPRSNQKTVSQNIDTVLTTLNRYFPNEIGVTANIYENPRKEITFVILDIVIEPKNAISIDLTLPGQNLADQVSREVSTLKSLLINKQPIDKTTSFTLIIKPPPNSDEKTIENITHVIISTISRIFPDNEIKFQTKPTKNDRGSITKMTLVISVEPNFSIDPKKKEKVVHIDLLKPGSDLTEEITKILPSLRDMLNEKDTTPITLTLLILPPKGSTEQFMQDTLKKVLFILTDNFPEDKVRSEVSAKKDPQGFIQNMKLVITVTPSTCTQKPGTTETLNINLINSEKELIPKIISILPKLNKLISKNHPANIQLIIKPPKDVTEETVQKFVKTVITILSKVYPFNKLEFQVKLVKNPQGTVENVTVLISIEPTNDNKIEDMPDLPETINIDLKKPGVKIVEEILNVLPTLKPKIEKKLKEGKPVNINLNVEPPNKATIDYVKRTANTVLTITTKLFPNNDVKVKAKISRDKHGKLRGVTFVISINKKPNEKSTPSVQELTTPSTTVNTQEPNNEINLDLSRPGINIPEEITTTLAKIKEKTPQPDEPISFQFNIKPPTGSNKKFVENTVDTVLTTLKTLYPNDEIKVNAKITKNSDHTIKGITITFVISPGYRIPENGRTTPSPKNIHEVKIDLSKPGTFIPREITTELVKIQPEVTKEIDEDQPLVLKIDIQPPKDSTEKFVKNTVKVVTTTLSGLFPDKKIVVNVDAIKNPKGVTTKLSVVLIIEPTSTEHPTGTTTNPEKITPIFPGNRPSTPKKTIPMRIHIDLSKPGIDLVNEVVNVLPDIKDEVILKHPKDQPVQVEFDIKPSKQPNKKFVEDTVQKIEEILTTVYPDNKIDFKVKLQRGKNNTINNITLVVTFEPSTSTENPFLVNLVTLKTTAGTEEENLSEEDTTLEEETTRKIEEESTPHENISKEFTTPVEEVTGGSRKTTLPVEENTKKETTTPSAEEEISKEYTTPREMEEKNTKEPEKITSISTPTSPNIVDETKKPIDLSKPETTLTEETITTLSTTPKGYVSTSRETEPQEVTEVTRPQKELSSIASTDGNTKMSTDKELTTPGKEITTTRETTESTTPSTTNIDETVSIDLTKPGTTLTEDIEELLPKITPKLEPKLDKNNPVTLEFKIKPPVGSNDDYLRTTTEELVSILTKIYPHNKMGIKTKGVKTPDNQMKEVTVEVVIEPESPEDVTRPHQKITSSTTPSITSYITEEETSPSKGGVHSTTPKEEITELETKGTPQEESSSTPTIGSKETTSSTHEGTTSSTPGETTSSTHGGTTSSTHGGTTSSTHRETTTSTHEVTPSSTHVETTSSTHGGTTSSTHGETTSSTHGGTTSSTHGGTTSSTHRGTTSSTHEVTPSSTHVGTTSSTHGGITSSTHKGTPSSTHGETTSSTHRGTTSSTHEETTSSTNEGTTSSTHEETTSSTNGGTTSSTHGGTTSSTHRGTTSSTHEVTPSSTHVGSTSSTHGGTTSSTHEGTPSSTHGETTSSTHRGTTSSTHEETTSSTNEGTTSSTHRETTSSTHGGTTSSTHRGTTSSTHEETTSSTQGGTTSSTHEETTSPTHEGNTSSTQGGTTSPTHEGNTSPTHEGTTSPTHEGTTSSTHQGTTSSTHRGTTSSTHKETTSSTHGGTPSSTHEGTTFSTHKETTSPTYGGTTSSTHRENTSSTHEVTPSSTHVETTSPTHEGTASSTHEGTTSPTHEGTASSTHEGTTSPTHEGNTSSTQEGTTSPTHEGTESSKHEGTTSPTHEGTTSSTHKETTSSTHEGTPSSTHRGTTFSTHKETTSPTYGGTTSPTHEKTTSSTHEGTPSSTHGGTTSSTHKGTTSSTHGGTTSSTHEETTSSTYGGTTSSTHEETTSSSNGGTPSSTYGVTPSSTHGGTTSSTHEETTSSTYRGTPSSTHGGTTSSTHGGTTSSTHEETTPSTSGGNPSVTHGGTTSSTHEGTTSSTHEETSSSTHIRTTSSTHERTTSSTHEGTTPSSVVTSLSTKETKEPTVTIDISKPGKTITDYVDEIIPKIVPKVEPNLKEDKPVVLEFKLKPPTGSDKNYPKETTKTIVETLMKYFPDNRINVKTHKTPDDELVFEIVIEPRKPISTPTTISEEFTSSTHEGTTPSSEGTSLSTEEAKQPTVTIDISKPGKTITDYVDEIIPKIVPEVKPNLKKDKPVVLEFKLKPPTGSDNNYLKDTTKTIVETLIKYFPDNKINVKIHKTPDDELVFEIVIEPRKPISTPTTISEEFTSSTHEGTTPSTEETKQPTVTIDISKPGKTITDYVDEIIPKIVPEVKPNLKEDKPVVLEFKLKPPTGSDKNYPKETTKTIIETLIKYFPDNKISVKTHETPDDELVFEIVIEPRKPISTPTTISEEFTSSTHEGTTPSTEETKQPTVTIDISKPGKTITDYVDEIIPKIVPEVKPNLKEDKPVVLEFKLKPPTGSDKNYLKDTTKTIVETLIKYFPHNKINVKIHKTPDDELVFEIVIEPRKPTSTPTTISEEFTSSTHEGTTPSTEETKQPTVTIDISKPGKTITDYVDEIIPKIVPEVKPNLNEDKPVVLEFKLKPPTGSDKNYPKETTETIIETLNKYFPDNKINVKTHKTPDDELVFEIVIEPRKPTSTPTTISEEFTSSTHEETTPSTEETKQPTVTIDISKPGKTITDYVDEIIPKIVPEVKPNLKEDKPVVLEFKLKPPTGSDKNYPKETTETIIETLNKYFPDNKINVKTHKTPDDELVFEIVIEPRKPTSTPTTISEEFTSSTHEGTTPSTEETKQPTVTIDISKPGKTITDYVDEIIPKIVPEVKPNLKEDKPVVLEFKLKPPTGSDKNYPKETTETIIETLNKYFPDNKINVKTHKTPDDELVFEIVIEPRKPTSTPTTISEEFTSSTHEGTTPSTEETKQPTVTIDISKPGKTITDYVDEIIPKIVPEVKPNLNEDKPVVLEFKLKPPTGSDKNYPKETTETIIETLNKYFPDNKINVKTHKTPDDELVFEIVIEPRKPTSTPTTISEEFTSSTHEETTPSTEETKQPTVTIDISKPGKTITDYVDEIIPKIVPEVKPNLKEDKPVVLEFKLKPPTGSDKNYPKETTETIIETLNKYFPDNKINVKTHKTPDDELVFEIVIEPRKPTSTPTTISEEFTSSTHEETTPSTEETKQPTVTIDISKPGKTITDYVDEIIPKIVPEVKPNLKEDKPVVLEFKLKPPTGSDKNYPKETTETIIETLNKYFPDNKINVKTHKTPDDELVFEIVIEPRKPTSTPTTISEEFTSSTHEGTTPSTEETKQPTVTIDISKPGKTITDYVDEIIPKIVPEVKPNLREDKPVVLEFKLKPPTGSDKNYPKETTETIIETLNKYFPDNKINVKTHKTPDDELVFEIVIEPRKPTSTPTTISEEFTSSTHEETTPSTEETKQPTVTIDISKPGKTITDYVDEIIPKIVPEVKPNLKEDKPVVLEFKLKPPTGSDKNYPKETTKTIVETLIKYFPDNKINVKTHKTPDDELVFEIVIEPRKPTSTSSTTSHTTEKETTIPSDETTPTEKITSSVNFETVPNEYTTTPSTLDNISKERTTPTEEISEWTTPKSNEGETEVDIDLSKPGTNLGDQIEELIPNILPNIKPVLEEERPITLSFKITPPKGSDQDYIDVTTQTLRDKLTEYFPDNKIDMKTTSEKNPQGYPNEIIVRIVIEPSKLGKPQDENIDIDLSKPDTSLSKEISTILPGILPKITTELNNKSPATLTFTIKTPNQTTENDLQTTIGSLHEILTKFFPNNEVKAKLKAKKNPQGHVTQIIVQITVVPTPSDENVDIDLSKPGVTLVPELIKILPDIIPKVSENLDDNKPVSIAFRIKPRPGVTESYLPVIKQTVENILKQYLPTNNISINMNAEKDSRNYLTEMVINITIEPSQNKPNGENVDIDLTKPGTTLLDKVQEVLPTILNDINDKLSKKQPVNLDFNIKPPSGSTETYLQDITQILQTIMVKYFPRNKISLKLNASKNPQGYITVVNIDITLQPPEDTTQPEENVDIDLTKSGSSLIDQVKEKMPDLQKQITDNLNDKHPVTVTLKIKPPTGSPESYLQDLTNSVVTILTTYYPNNKIALKVNAEKNPQGYLTMVTLEMTLKPSSTSPEEDNNVDIDLTTPGSTLISQVKERMPGLLNQIKDKLSTKNPVSLTFKIKPPTGSPESYLQDLTNSVTNILTTYFPNNKIAVQLNAQKNPKGYLTLITLETTLEPSPKSPVEQNNVDIDLTTPGATLINQVKEKMPGLLTQIREKLNTKNPVPLTFKIKPPTGSTESYLQDLTNSVVNILTTYFPNNKILVKLSAKKNPQGYITLVTLELTLEPSTTSPVEENNVDIDLTTPGATLINQVKEKMPGLLTQITEKLNTKNPVPLTFKIKPPTGSTESYLQDLTNSVVNILTTYFPNNKIAVQLNAKKNPQGYITLVTLELTLEPSTTSPVEENNVDIDLTPPGATLINQVKEKMPGLLTQITEKLNTKNPVPLTFKIKPPTGSTESYLQDLTNSVVNILTTYFPNNKILVKLSAKKNPQGYITLVTLELTLEPSTTSPVEENNVDIDLTKPGSTLIDQVKEKMPNLLNQITSELNSRNPVTLTFKVKPPNGSPESYLQDLTNSVVTILTNYFPKNQIAVTIKAQKNPQGYITLVTLDMTLQPPSPQTRNIDDVDVDLTKPGVTLKDEMDNLLPTLKQNLTQELSNNRPVNLGFKIKPPKGTTPSYLQVISENLQSIVTDYFPDNKVSLEISAQKDSQGYITVVTIEIKLEPSSSSLLPPEENVDIDLSKPGVTLTNQIGTIMPDILPKITKDLSLKKPVTLRFKVKPPPRSTQSYLQTVGETLEGLLAKYLPNNEISVSISSQKDSQNFFSLITITITIQPSVSQLPQERNIEVDLTRPGINFIDQVSQYLNKISPEVSSNLDSGKPVNISVGVKPPSGSNDNYIQMIVNSLVPILGKIFPNNKVNLETNAEKDSQGYISEILLIIRIELSSQTKGYNVDIDLANSRFSLEVQMDNIIPNIYPQIQDDLNSGESVTLSIKVLPPSGSRQDYLQSLTESLIPILSNLFPGNKMRVKTSATKNSQGYLSSITDEITILTQVQQKRVDIDLSKPGSTLEDEVASLLPSVLPNLKSDLSRGKPITLKFNIRPPVNSNKSFLNSVTNQLVVILPKYFPSNRMSVKTSSTEDSRGFISDVVLLISIQP